MTEKCAGCGDRLLIKGYPYVQIINKNKYCKRCAEEINAKAYELMHQ